MGCVSWWNVRAVRSRHSLPTADLDHPGAELQPEHQPPEEHDDHGRRRLVGRSEERREEPRLDEEHLPAEPVERLADRHDREVAEPQREEAEHRHPGRAELGESHDERRRDGRSRRRTARRGGDRCRRTRRKIVGFKGQRDRVRAHASSSRRGQEAPLAEQRPELVQRRDERHHVEGGDPALQHLAGEPEVDCREPVHGFSRRDRPVRRRLRRCR